MSIDICRQFVLHNDFIPPTDKTHNWDYLAFGYIDGISVTRENVFLSRKGDLKCLWEDSVRSKAELVKQESRQVVYGFRSEDKAGNEKAFWEDRDGEDMYPFLFFIMIQFEDAGRKNLSRLLECRESVEQKFNQTGRVKGITYLTLDNSNLLLILRSRQYEDGAEIVDRIHRKEPFYLEETDIWKVRYSFTIPAVNKHYLNFSGFDDMQGKRLYRAYIYAMELTAGSIQPFYNELESELKKELGGEEGKEQKNWISKQSVLGYNDELIILSDIPWPVFLKLYRNGKGVLNHSHKKYQKHVSCLTTIIGYEQKTLLKSGGHFLNTDAGESEIQRKNKEVQSAFFIFLQNRLAEFVKANQHHEACDSMFLSMHHLVNCLSKFEKDCISGNMFLPSAFSVYLLLEILIEIFNDEVLFDVNKCYREYRMFLNGLNSYAQNPMRSDRQFTQVIEFNVKTYNLPIKLNAFYNAFIFWVRDFLNETSKESMESMHSYEFLTCPGVSLHMYVEELFEGFSSDKRLFLVNIPESQVYNLEQMMIMLCHEIGHFVGGHIRDRSTRKTRLIRALARTMAQYYKDRTGLQSEIYDSFWEGFEERLCQEIEKDYEQFYDPKIIEKIYTRDGPIPDEQHCENARKAAKYWKQRCDRSIVMKAALLDAAVRVIKRKESSLFRKALYQCYMDRYQNAGKDKREAEYERKRAEKRIADASKDLIQVGLESADAIHLEGMIETLMYICKEGLSDIIVIMTLELEMEQYLRIILKSAREQGQMEELLNREISMVGIRVSLVIACMIGEKKDRELGYGWKKKSTLSEDAEEAVKQLQHNVNVFIARYMGKNCDRNAKPSQYQRVCDYCCDWKLLLEIRKYLLKCRESCAALIGRKKEEQKKVWEIFGVSKTDTVESAMLQIESVIDEYRDQIQQKMSKIIESGKDDGRDFRS